MTEEIVRFETVSKSFNGNAVLREVSFAIPRGTAFCLLGRSGVGKSVTLKLLVGLLRPDEGRIWVDGRDITAASGPELVRLRKRIGFLFQQAALFDSISVGENVAFPLRRHTELAESEVRSRAQALLDQVGLGRDYDKMPADLSGGMRKRAGLARALALDPPLLLVDEPSAGLDPITSVEIDDLLLRLKQESGVTLLVVTHNIPSARRIGDRLAFIEQGRIVASGSAAELEASDDPMVRQFLSSETGG
jgi:phospholipid/cholesterol/gamma-HCH transport system ATP-binding protein